MTPGGGGGWAGGEGLLGLSNFKRGLRSGTGSLTLVIFLLVYVGASLYCAAGSVFVQYRKGHAQNEKCSLDNSKFCQIDILINIISKHVDSILCLHLVIFSADRNRLVV